MQVAVQDDGENSNSPEKITFGLADRGPVVRRHVVLWEGEDFEWRMGNGEWGMGNGE